MYELDALIQRFIKLYRHPKGNQMSTQSFKATILDGSPTNDSISQNVNAAMVKILEKQGWDVEHFLLREKKIGNCDGDFFCWIRTPGICKVNDDNRRIAESIVKSDLLVYLTPVTFGGYSSMLKKAVDHQIQIISPFFTQINGETHHEKRYESYPDFLAIGWMDAPDEKEERVFRNLAWRNALNFHSEKAATGLVFADQTQREVENVINAIVKNMKPVANLSLHTLPNSDIQEQESTALQQAVLLVGSPRTKKSTSYALGSYLLEKLSDEGIETRTIYIHTSLRSPERLATLLKTVKTADLVVLAFPLYVDSLPAPTIEALERIAASRNGAQTPQRFAAIANCGFPEAHHNATALAICETFAHSAGFHWAGSLALGGGEGMVHGTPLNEMDGRAIPLKKALTLAAEALINGENIPSEAQVMWDKPFIPNWLYRLIGKLGWQKQAKKYNAQKNLKRRTYAN